MSDSISIEVVFATAERQEICELEVPSGTSLIEGIHLSEISTLFPDLDLDQLQKGIWSQLANDDYVLQAHDRIEIYRSLVTDAKEARRKRANRGKYKDGITDQSAEK
jgi:putative ubiquitin-RnfH superfamily antitoxin RatB of RatAB toxin-antitoxin module